MQAYLEDKTFFVNNGDDLIYKVESMEIYDGYDSLRLNLVLVGGQNETGIWLSFYSFPEDAQFEQEICYIMQESVKECLEANGYEVLEELPAELKKIIEREKGEIER